MSGADDSGASTNFRWWSRSSWRRRCREDVRERAPDGAEERRAVVLHVGQEARCGESPAQQQRRARLHRREHARRERVAVEQRHRAVEDVVGRRTPCAPRPRGAALGHADGLRRARRARREDQEVQRLRVGPAGARSGAQRVRSSRGASSGRGSRRRRRPAGGRPAIPRSRPSRSGTWSARGDDEAAVGVADVAGELLAAARRVDADDRGARERRAAEQEEVLGDVLEQDADVERVRGRAASRSSAARRRHSTTISRQVHERSSKTQPRAVVGGPALDELRDGGGHDRVVQPRSATGSVRIPAISVDSTRSGRADDLVVRVAREQLLEEHARLEAGERGAEAEVLAEAEREVRGVRPAGSRRSGRRRARTRARRGCPTRRA